MAICELCEEWCPDEREDDYGVAWCWQCERDDHVVKYETYLKSEEWASVRRRKLLDAEFKCEHCGYTPGIQKRKLEVHHKTYERLGEELMFDLEVLCFNCHKKEHGLGWKIKD